MTIKIICLNLWWGGYLFPAILDFLEAGDADILALQEVHGGSDTALESRYRSVRVLQERLGYRYHDYARAFVYDGPAGKIPEGNAVFSKFPISSRSARFLVEPTQAEYRDEPEDWPILPRVLQHVAMDTPAGALNVFNFHGVWDLDGDNDSPARRGMVKAILEETAGKANVILAGDTNAKSTNPALRPLEGSLKSVFGTELATTFNMRRKEDPGYASAAVDLMYISPEVRVLTKDVPDVDISDHLPLVVSLEIP